MNVGGILQCNVVAFCVILSISFQLRFWLSVLQEEILRRMRVVMLRQCRRTCLLHVLGVELVLTSEVLCYLLDVMCNIYLARTRRKILFTSSAIRCSVESFLGIISLLVVDEDGQAICPWRTETRSRTLRSSPTSMSSESKRRKFSQTRPLASTTSTSYWQMAN